MVEAPSESRSRSHYVGAVFVGDRWLAVAFGSGGHEATHVTDGIGPLWGRYEETAARILVSVPIGLLEGGETGRGPEPLARELLGPQADRVVDPPVREATRRRRYPAAARVNERTTGQPLAEAAFALAPGIAAVDELLQELPEARRVVAEAHPELCFRAFAGHPLDEPRTTAGGYAERMRALADVDRNAPPTVQTVAEETAGHDVRVENVLDAVALAYTAHPGTGSLHTLPPEPRTDPTGLPMRMVYRAEQSLPVAGDDPA